MHRSVTETAPLANRIGCGLAIAVSLTLLTSAARADDRRFTFLDESRHHPPSGGLEYEQGILWGTDTKEDSSFNRIDFRHELEYGLSDKIQVAVDVAEWHWQHDDMGSETKYDATGGEFKYRFMDPVTDLFGLAFKVEVELGPHELEWENVFIIDKVFDKWELCYNFVVEPDWEGEKYFHYDEHGGELVNRFGVSYEISPAWFVGGELLWEIPLPDWKTGEHQNLFLGPNFSYRGHNWAITTTAVFLATGGDDEAKFKLQTIFEIDF
jgi:hypothetical protein